MYPAIAWYDTRTEDHSQWLRDHIGASTIYSITGLPISTSYGLTKLMWLRDNEPDIYHCCQSWLPIGDYIGYRLCDIQCTDRTQAWRTMAYDISKMNWSGELLLASGVNPGLMTDIVQSGLPIGIINRDSASQTGLSPECLLVSGGMDAVCGMIAVGAVSPGVILDIIGTSEILLTTLESPQITQAGMLASLDVGPHAVSNRYLAFGSMTASGAIVDWFARLVSAVDSKYNLKEVLAELTHEAEEENNTTKPILVLPHFRGCRTPYSDVYSRGLIAGLDLTTTHGQIFLGMLEGLCLESQLLLDSLEKLSAQVTKTFWVAGGASENPLWMSQKADILGQDILVPDTTNISAYGAALLAAYGSGDFSSIDDVTSQMAVQPHTHFRAGNIRTKYHERYSKGYKKLYSLFRRCFIQLFNNM